MAIHTNTDAVLQLFGAALFVLGVLAVAISRASVEGVGLAAEDAFYTGVVFTGVGAVVLIDGRRRASRPSAPS